jgi:hypothetical protein
MTLQEAFDFLNFWINKNTGAYYTIPELELITDRGQMSLYEDLQPKYATSQRIKDALSPFRAVYNFTPSNTVSGYIVIPSNSNYLNLLDAQIEFNISDRKVYAPIDMVNEDERANRLNSQIDPVTSTSPIGEIIAPRYIRLYPTSAPGYTGAVTYFRRPVKPVFGYTTISGRVIVYNSLTSTQLEWGENWVNAVLIKALGSIGINLSDQEIQQYSELKSQSNYQSVNMV